MLRWDLDHILINEGWLSLRPGVLGSFSLHESHGVAGKAVRIQSEACNPRVVVVDSFISSPLCLFFSFVPFSRPRFLPPCLHRERIQCILFLCWCFKHFFCCLFWLCHMACGILVPWPGIKPMPLALETVLTTGPPGKCPYFVFIE